MSIIPGGPRQGGAADPSTLLPPREEQPNQKPGAGGEGTDADAVTPGDPDAGAGEPNEQTGNTGGKETGGSPADAVAGDRSPGQSDPLNGNRGDHPGWDNNGWGNNGRGNGWGNGGIPPGLADKLGNFGNQGGQPNGGNGLISGTLNQAGQLVSNLGTLIFGRNPAGGDVLLPRTTPDSSFDAGNAPGRNGPSVSGNDPGRVVDTGGRAPGTSNPQTAPSAGSGRTDGPPVPRGNTETTTTAPNPGGQPVATGRPAGAEVRSTPLAGGNTAATPQAMPQSAQAQGQAGVLTAALSAAAAQQALLGGLAANQAAVPQQAALPQNAPLQQNAQLQNALARQAAGLPLTPEQRALLQGAQVPNPANTPQAQEKPLSAPPQQVPRGEDLRNPQQLPAEARRQAETLDRSLAKQTAEQQARTPNDPRATDAQARADAKALREGVDNKTRANLADARQTVGDNTRPNSQLANAERRLAGATESLRHALDWVGQQVRGVGTGARTDEEGVTAMRVVAGLVVAATVVGVAIAVLYALRVAFVP